MPGRGAFLPPSLAATTPSFARRSVGRRRQAGRLRQAVVLQQAASEGGRRSPAAAAAAAASRDGVGREPEEAAAAILLGLAEGLVESHAVALLLTPPRGELHLDPRAAPLRPAEVSKANAEQRRIPRKGRLPRSSTQRGWVDGWMDAREQPAGFGATQKAPCPAAGGILR